MKTERNIVEYNFPIRHKLLVELGYFIKILLSNHIL